MKFVLFIFSVVFLQQLLARSVQNDEYTRLDGGSLRIIEEQINYLINYGYLDKISARSQEKIIEAIGAFQYFFSLPVTGVIDEATSELMKAPRCGNQDVFKNKARYVLSPLGGWKKRHLTYYLVNVTAPLTLKKAAELTQIALNHWSSASNLTFKRAYNTNADIVIDFREAVHGDGDNFADPVFAHAFVPNNVFYVGEVHLWTAESWTFDVHSNKEAKDFYSTVLHELGHTLGLMHSSEEAAVMYPYYSIRKTTDKLPNDDRMGMYQLYRKKSLEMH